jgi:hypothetical protein
LVTIARPLLSVQSDEERDQPIGDADNDGGSNEGKEHPPYIERSYIMLHVFGPLLHQSDHLPPPQTV